MAGSNKKYILINEETKIFFGLMPEKKSNIRLSFSCVLPQRPIVLFPVYTAMFHLRRKSKFEDWNDDTFELTAICQLLLTLALLAHTPV